MQFNCSNALYYPLAKPVNGPPEVRNIKGGEEINRKKDDSVGICVTPSSRVTNACKKRTSLQLDQFGSGQSVKRLAVLERVFQIPPRHSCMLSGQNLSAHTFAVGNCLDNRAMLIR